MKHFLAFPVSLLLLTNILFAQPITWQRVYKSQFNNDHQAFTICPAEGTNTYVSGLTSDPQCGYIMKLNQYGDTLWSHILIQHSYITSSISLSDGGCLVGTANGSLLRFNTNGDIISTTSTGIRIDDILRYNDSLIYFVGWNYTSNIIIGKGKIDCSVSWQRPLSISRFAGLSKIAFNSTNELILSGYVTDTLTNRSSPLIAKTDTSANLIWYRTYILNQSSVVTSLISNNNYIISAGYQYFGANTYKVFLLKSGQSGDSVATKFFLSNFNQRVPTILKSNSDGLYFSYSIDSVSIFNVACINNLDSDLNLKIRLIIPPVRDYLIIHQMMYAPNSPYGEIYLAGETNFNSSSTTYMYVARIDSSLNVLPPPIEVRQISNIIPKHFELVGNYPNPFNPNTRIVFDVPKSADVRITVFDVLGREVATLINKKLAPGKYEVDFNGTNLPSGIYFYRLTSANYSQTKKMALVK